MAGIHSPANAGLVNPDPDSPQFLIVEPKALTERRTLQQGKNLRRRVAAAGQLQQAQERADHRAVAARCAVGKAEWNPQIRVFGVPEHGMNKRRVAFDIRSHDHDVPRPERGVVGEQVEKLVVEHLRLAHRRMAGVELHGAVRWRDGQPVERLLAQFRSGQLASGCHRNPATVARAEDIRLQRVQHAIRCRFEERFAFIDDPVPRAFIRFQQDSRELGVEFAKGGEQRVPLRRRVQPAPGKLPGRQVVAIIFPRGRKQEKMHRTHRRQRKEHLHLCRRQRRDAENRDALRQRGVGRHAALQFAKGRGKVD